MPDEQIIKEIKSLIKALKDNNGWWENEGRGGWFNYSILEDALTVIQRQNAEIDRLTAERDEARRDCAVAERNHALAVEERVANVKGFTEQLKTARADAVREFAERLEAFVKEKFDIADGLYCACDDDDEGANAFYGGRIELLHDVSNKIKSIVRELTEGEQ